MRTAAKLAGFGALLAVVGGASALAGGVVDPDPTTSEETHAMTTMTHEGTEAHGGHAAAAAVKGLAISEAGYTLEPAARDLPRGRDAVLRFRVTDRAGRPVTRFDVTHERRMHLIVVRRDGTGFQHLHPTMDRQGAWSSRIRLAEGGAYRMFADFSTQGRALTLGADLAVDGPAAYAALPAPAAEADTGTGYRVRLEGAPARAGRESSLRFTVTRDGRTVHTQPYLGAGGHLVALREGDLAFLHTHPADHDAGDEAAHDDAIPFETTFPTAGRYRLYLQFRAGGRVHTAGFTREVTR